MATITDYLQLVLPLNNEYQDTWDQPANGNFQKINDWAKDIGLEIVNARGGEASIADFLAISHNPDGSLKATEEVVKGRSSFLYGDETPASADMDLAARLDRGDREVFNAKEGYPTLRDALSSRSLSAAQVISGAKDGNGYPSWLGFTGVNVQVDGSVNPLRMMIDGYICRVRKLEQVTISGAFGTKYLYAKYEPAGKVRVDASAGTNGTIGSDGTKVRILQDLTLDFSTQDVVDGDVINILGVSANAGEYQLRVVSPAGNNNRVQIYGVFPGGAAAGLGYTISDPFAVTLGFDSVKGTDADKLYIGEVDWDGFAVTAVRPLHFKDAFVGEWRSVDVTALPGTFTETWNHNLFDDALDVTVQVSQANDGSLPVEELSTASLVSTLGVSVTNGLVFSPGTFNPGSSNATYNPLPSLTGTISAALTGTIVPDRSARVQWTNKQVSVKNLIAQKFYTDFTNAVRQTGYIRVVVRKRRV